MGQEQPPGPVVGDFEAIASAPTGQSTREYTAFVRSYAQAGTGPGGATETIDWTPYDGFPGTVVDASKSRTTLVVNWNVQLNPTGIIAARLTGVVQADNQTVAACQPDMRRAAGQDDGPASAEMRCEVPQGYISGFANIQFTWGTSGDAINHRHSIMVVQTEVINVTQLFMVDGNVTFPAGSFNLEQNVTNQTVTNLTTTNQSVTNQSVENLTVIDDITVTSAWDFWLPFLFFGAVMWLSFVRRTPLVAFVAMLGWLWAVLAGSLLPPLLLLIGAMWIEYAKEAARNRREKGFLGRE